MMLKLPKPETFIVVNPLGEVFSGMEMGEFKFSKNWDDAKPLEKSNTKFLMKNKENELINTKDL